MSRNFKDIVKDFQHALNISYQNTRNIVKVSERYLAELAEAEQSGGSSDYSETEHVVGKWIDGTTDVYEKTIVYDTPLSIPYDTWVDSGISSSANIGFILSATVTSENTGGSTGGSIQNIEIMPGAGGYTIGIQYCVNQSGRNIKYLTLRYLKTS